MDARRPSCVPPISPPQNTPYREESVYEARLINTKSLRCFEAISCTAFTYIGGYFLPAQVHRLVSTGRPRSGLWSIDDALHQARVIFVAAGIDSYSPLDDAGSRFSA